MTIMDKFKNHQPMIQEDTEPNNQRRVQGRITLINEEGWGFISSKEIPFRRIFFHWSFLDQDQPALNEPKELSHFEQLEEGMMVEFKPLDIPEKGWRAIKIKILEKQ